MSPSSTDSLGESIFELRNARHDLPSHSGSVITAASSCGRGALIECPSPSRGSSGIPKTWIERGRSIEEERQAEDVSIERPRSIQVFGIPDDPLDGDGHSIRAPRPQEEAAVITLPL